MTRRHLLLIVLVAACAFALPGRAFVAGPALRLADRSPLTLAGLHFKAGERVRVTATVKNGRAHVMRSVANANGSFRAVFADLSIKDPCVLQASATGSRGTKAAYDLSERICPTGDPPAIGGVGP